ncbi:GNAT family N-acetyltransferase [Streptomyces sp. NPDC051907]|uniref:GNAT family N-acetyltransferase n=1 Tax=Streptomyces sp. NPDC051907 TaxID=3155284 RepID=UPI00341ABBE0
MTVVLRVAATPSQPALLLRPWHEGDLDALVEAHLDPLIRRFTRAGVESREDAVRWLEIRRHGWDTGEYLGFAVLEDLGADGEGALVGNTALKRPGLSAPAAEVGYWTSPAARGRGVAVRALEAVTGWAFDAFADEGLEQLELLHQVDNVASCRVAQKCGYAYETTLAPHPPFPLEGHLHLRKAR